MNRLPKLPPKAAYLFIDNAGKRNALSRAVIQDLTGQLRGHLRTPLSDRPVTLPPFEPQLTRDLESQGWRWLIDPREWSSRCKDLPSVVVLRSLGPVFSSGHDLSELAGLSTSDRAAVFRECAALMNLLRTSPVPVVCAVQGLATAAGAQLALSADITIARAETQFQLPGMSIGVPCTSPVTAVGRRVGWPTAYRMFATADKVCAEDLGGAVDVVKEAGDEAFERRVAETVERLVHMPAQPQAFGKWAFWTQAGMRGKGDGYEEAAKWAGEAMAMHLKGGEAKEGVTAFLEKRKPSWST